ncbi:MAG TPA: acetolactate synthase small subunit [Clostridia bacterium]|nr:acetolactate synthase small subunit [Clostridia bacterium]
MNERFVVGLLVSNRHGVLNRIAGLYGKRGYNIDCLAVGETEDPSLSRMTIVSTGDVYTRTQVVKQLNKLHDVKRAVLLDDDTVSVEHLLIKLKANGGGNAKIVEHINSFGGKVVDLGEKFIIADITGNTEKINECIQKSIPFGILELCRSGSIALSTGKETIMSVDNRNGLQNK